MKILLTIHHDLDLHSGASGSVLKLGQCYQQLGHTVDYYAFDHLPKRLPGMVTGTLFPEFLAAHLLKTSNSYDIIDASTGDAWLWGSRLRYLTRSKALLVTRSHGLEHMVHLENLAEAAQGNLHLSWKYPIYHGGFRLWEVATSLRCADLVFLLNQQDLKYATDVLGVQSHRAHVTPNGIPDSFLNYPLAPLPADNNTLKIACIGTYITRKGIHYSVPALNQVLAQFPGVSVTFFGTACPAEQVLADFEPTVRDRVHVISRFQHHTLPDQLQGYTIKLFTPLTEGFGKALVEAMACGLAPITTAAAGPLEVVRDGYDAVLIPLRDSTAIEQALERLIRDRPFLEQLRRNAYTTAQTYSWMNAARQRLQLYEQAIAAKGKQRNLAINEF